MTRYARASMAAGLMIAAAVACSSTPTRFYTLSALATADSTPTLVSVAVGRVRLPGVVDTTRVVVGTGANEVRLSDFDRWASPLPEGIAQAVASDLATILGSPRVTLTSDALGPDPDFRVAIEVQRFDSLLGDAAVLEAVWVVRRHSDGRVQVGRTSRREAAAGHGVSGLAAAHSRALASLSADIAASIRASDSPSP